MRLFVATPIPFHPELEGIYHELRSDIKGVRPVDPKKQHVTLKFIGDPGWPLEDVVSALEGIGERTSPFESRIQGYGAFPDWRHPSVLWLSLAPNEPFAELASKVDFRLSETLGSRIERRSFLAHITIGRVKENKGVDRQRLKDLLGASVERLCASSYAAPIKEVLLKNSELTPNGPEYSTVQNYPLSGP